MGIINLNELNVYRNIDIEDLKSNHLYVKGKDLLKINQTYSNLIYTLQVNRHYLSKKMIRRYLKRGYAYEGYLTVDNVKRPKEEILFELKNGNKDFSMYTEIKRHVFKKYDSKYLY